jgi:hypothetical protein
MYSHFNLLFLLMINFKIEIKKYVATIFKNNFLNQKQQQQTNDDNSNRTIGSDLNQMNGLILLLKALSCISDLRNLRNGGEKNKQVEFSLKTGTSTPLFNTRKNHNSDTIAILSLF